MQITIGRTFQKIKWSNKKKIQGYLKNICRCDLNQGVLTQLDGHAALQCRIWREGLAEVRVHVYHIPAPPAGHKSYVVSLKD